METMKISGPLGVKNASKAAKHVFLLGMFATACQPGRFGIWRAPGARWVLHPVSGAIPHFCSCGLGPGCPSLVWSQLQRISKKFFEVFGIWVVSFPSLHAWFGVLHILKVSGSFWMERGSRWFKYVPPASTVCQESRDAAFITSFMRMVRTQGPVSGKIMLLLIVNITNAKDIHCLSTYILACYMDLSLFRELFEMWSSSCYIKFYVIYKTCHCCINIIASNHWYFFFWMHLSSVFKDFVYARCGRERLNPSTLELWVLD